VTSGGAADPDFIAGVGLGSAGGDPAANGGPGDVLITW
jgi:hypothetical protein